MKKIIIRVDKLRDRDVTSIDGMSLQNSADGILKCLDNAEDLIQEALYLEKKGKKARALSLYIIALEETSKTTYILTEASFSPSSLPIKRADTKFFLRKFKGTFGHKSKQLFGLGIYELEEEFKKRYTGKKYQEAYKLVNVLTEKIQPFVEKARQDVFYVNFVAGKFLLPEELLKLNSHFSDVANYKKLKINVIKQVTDSRKMFGKDRKSCMYFLKGMRLLMSPKAQKALEDRLSKNSLSQN